MQNHRTTWGVGTIHAASKITIKKGHRTFSAPIKPKKSKLSKLETSQQAA